MEPGFDARPAGRAAWRRWPRWLITLIVLSAVPSACAFAQTPVTLYRSIVGHVNYQATGGSLRSAPNTTNACSLAATSSATLTGIPPGATIQAAYLYWVGSGGTVDSSIALNGSARSAARTFTARYALNGTNYDFFSGFADVTSAIAGNGTVTFGGLAVNNGATYCDVEAVVAGWGLVVVYAHASEDLRAVNVFDGFQLYRGSSLSLALSGFRIPPVPVNGKVTHLTWEGDPQNSGTQNGVAESLTFNGSLLDDGLVPAGSAPAQQQFDGTVNSLGVLTSYGVDVDTYDVSAFLAPGNTSATTTYSSGADLVLLSAEVISFTTEPIVDLSISKSHAGDLVAGGTASYLIRVSNAGPETEPNTVSVTDTLPAGLTYVGAAGSGWTCSATSQAMTCTNDGPLAAGAALPDLTLTAQVGLAAAPSVANTATVTSNSVDNTPANNSSTDTAAVRTSNLATSTKSVVDLNGGDANPGDVLRYTIDLRETGGVAASGVRVVDTIPARVTGFTVTSLPAGAVDASAGAPSGANGTGRLDAGAISIPANGSASVVFEVTVAGTAQPGDVISNVAAITNGTGTGATPAAPNVIVSESLIPSGGTKTLYLYDTATVDPNGFNAGARPYLSRTPPATAQADVGIDPAAAVAWRLTPALQAPLTLAAGSIPVTLYLSKNAATGATQQLTLRAALGRTGASSGAIGTTVTQTFNAPPASSPTAFTFNIPLAAPITVSAGTQITLTLTNTTGGGGTRRVRVWPRVGAAHSRIDLPATTVINVDSVASYGAAFPSTAARTTFGAGMAAALRAVVSDPFGRFDIESVVLDVVNPSGTTVVAAQAMPAVQQTSGASATYEVVYSLPATAATGHWTYRVTAIEGAERIVRDTRTGAFEVVRPLLTVSKSVAPLSDPVNGAAVPKAIPGAVMLYSLSVANLGALDVDTGTLAVRDVLPAGQALYVSTASGDPIVFVDGSPASGLTYSYAAAVRYSNQPGGGAPFDYTPTPDAAGFDGAVTGISVNPEGSLAASSGSGAPLFQLRYRLRVE
jgi:uncharacterized repeat protein (TIGR01451 family)